MLKCVVSADWHLDAMQKVLTNPLPIQIREIHKIYQYALSRSIPHFFVPGDLCHRPNMSEEALLLLLTMLFTYDGSINTYYTLGNHDVESIKNSSLDILAALADAGSFKTFKVYKQPTVEVIDGIHVAFMPFPHIEVPKTRKVPLIFAHIEEEGAVGDNGRPMKYAKEPKEVLTRVEGDFLVTGHLHQTQYIKKRRTLYPGTPYQTKFDELLPKGFLDLEAKYVDSRLKVSYTHVDNRPEFILKTVFMDTQESWSELTDDPAIRYKVLVEEGVVIPKDVMRDYSNIVSIKGVSLASRVEMEGIIADHATEASLPSFRITTGLKSFLKHSGHDKKHISKALSEAKAAADFLGIS